MKEKENENILVEKQKFYTAEFEQEAAWLSFIHREGWRFLSTDGFHYRFEAAPKEDWCYQLDYKQNGVAEDDYLQMYQDFGWEFAGQYGNWFYFRKQRTNGEEPDLSLFSDRESKLELCKRIINGQLLRILPLLLIMCGSCSLLLLGVLLNSGGFLSVIIGIAYFIQFALFLLPIGNYFSQMARLNKMMKGLDGQR